MKLSVQHICSVCVTVRLCPRNQRFEVQQAALHQQLLALQNELATMKPLYDSLLEQVGQQSGFIQQLSELQQTSKSENKVSGKESEKTEAVGEFENRCGPAAALT